MRIYEFSDFSSFTDTVIKELKVLLKADTCASVDIICNFSDAKRVIANAISRGIDIAFLSVQNPEFCDYDREYIIALNNTGIWCEEAMNGNSYCSTVGDITYVFPDVNSAILKKIKKRNYAYEVRIGRNQGE